MRINNKTADCYLAALKLVSKEAKGKFGYAVARNIRELSTSLKEYIHIKNELIVKYGKCTNNEYVLNMKSKEFIDFQEEIKEIAEIEHDINIMMIEPEYIYQSSLTADLIDNIMFMILEEGDNNG